MNSMRNGLFRFFSTTRVLFSPTEGETRITQILKNQYQKASLIEVQDVSSKNTTIYMLK